MKRRSSLQKQKTGQKSWFSVFVLSFIVIFLAIFVYKINSSVTIDSQAAGGCSCGELRCFNGNNIKKASTADGSQCCFGWPKGRLESVKIGTCERIPLNNANIVTPSIIPSETSGISNNVKTSCLAGTVGYGFCRGRSVWVKINENFDPTKDQVKILGYYTDKTCKNSFICDITSPSPTPTIIVKNKKVNLSNPNSFNLIIVNGYLIDGFNNALLSEFGLNTFFAGAKYTLDLTNDKRCQKSSKNPENKFILYFVYRKSGFLNMLSTQKSTTYLPCEQDNFSIDVPLNL